MLEYNQTRQNMVDCQIRPNGVILPALIHAFEATPREWFVPDVYKHTAYNDEDIHLGGHRYLLEPAIFGKMVQALEPQPDDVVLYIGGDTGYGPAIVAPLVSTLIVLESNNDFITTASRHWDELGLCNIVSVEGALQEGSHAHAPYDSILINGAVANIPDTILDQLAPNGRMVCVEKPVGRVMGQVKIVQKSSSGICSSQALFEAGTPYLQGFEPKEEFQF